MISFQDVQLRALVEKGQKFKWKRPVCSCGNTKTWKHDFVPRYFDGFSQPLLCRRFRCPKCGSIITTRPKAYFERIQASIGFVLAVLLHRFLSGFWPRGVSRQRALPWLTSVTDSARFLGINIEKVIEDLESNHHPNLRITKLLGNPPSSFVESRTEAG